MPLTEAVDICVEAERLGYTDVWSYEVGGYDAFTPLAAIASRTERVRLGTAVVPAATRPPALLAMTAASLQDLSKGRFCLGLGTSTPTIVNRWMGVPFPPGLAHMRTTVEAIRAITAGEKVNGFRLEHGAVQLPIYVGALGPRMLELAAEIADGVILASVTAEHVARGDKDVVLTVPVVLDAPEALEKVRESLAAYGVIDVYNRHFARQGFEDEARDLRAAWEHRSWPEAVAAVSDRMVDAMCVSGNLDECRAGLARYRDAGVTTLLISPVTRIRETLAALRPSP